MMGSGGQRWHAIHLILLGLVATSPLVLVQSVWAHANLLRAAPESSAVLQQPTARVLRWLILLSALAVVGGLGFVLLVSRALLARRATRAPVRLVGTQVIARTVQHIWIAMGVLLVASIGQLLDHTAVAAELPFY